MDEEQFFHLFVNANGLAELGLRAALVDLENLEGEGPGPEIDAGEMPDFDEYLDQAYGAEDLYKDRVEAAFGKADLAELDGILGNLGSDLAPLTGRLTGEQFGTWLDLYRDAHDVLTDLLTKIRALDS